MSTRVITLAAGRGQEDERRRGDGRGTVAAGIAAVFMAALFGAAAAGVGGEDGLAGLLRFRQDGRGIAVAGLIVLSLFVAAVAMTCGVFASGGRQRLIILAANVTVKVTLLIAVAFMLAFPHCRSSRTSR